MNKILNFFVKSHAQNPRLFYVDMAGTISVLIASFTLSLNADNPDMRYIYPFFFIGTMCGMYTNYHRVLVFPLILMCVFCLNNIFGYGVASGWW